MSFRIIGKLCFLAVITGFFMPMQCEMNGFELIRYAGTGLTVALLGTFAFAVIGFFMGLLLLGGSKIPGCVDWLVIFCCLSCGLVPFFVNIEAASSFQEGVYVMGAGYALVLLMQLLSMATEKNSDAIEENIRFTQEYKKGQEVTGKAPHAAKDIGTAAKPETAKKVATVQPRQREYQTRNKGDGMEKRINKHIYTWVGSLIFGWLGADRFMRGQIALGILKLFFGFLVWPFVDWAIALTKLGDYKDDFVFAGGRWAGQNAFAKEGAGENAAIAAEIQTRQKRETYSAITRTALKVSPVPGAKTQKALGMGETVLYKKAGSSQKWFYAQTADCVEGWCFMPHFKKI